MPVADEPKGPPARHFGRELIKSTLLYRVHAAAIYSVAFPDMHRELHDLYFDGVVVVVRLTLHGTHKGDLPTALGTIPGTGKEFHVPSCDVFRLEDGKV